MVKLVRHLRGRGVDRTVVRHAAKLALDLVDGEAVGAGPREGQAVDKRDAAVSGVGGGGDDAALGVGHVERELAAVRLGVDKLLRSVDAHRTPGAVHTTNGRLSKRAAQSPVRCRY